MDASGCLIPHNIPDLGVLHLVGHLGRVHHPQSCTGWHLSLLRSLWPPTRRSPIAVGSRVRVCNVAFGGIRDRVGGVGDVVLSRVFRVVGSVGEESMSLMCRSARSSSPTRR